MRKIVVLLFILVLLTVSCVIETKPVSSDEVFEDSWMSKAPMTQARTGLGVATLNGKIYAIGGSNASGSLPSVGGGAVLGYNDLWGHVGTTEEYDPESDTWTTKTSMPTPRIVFATAVWENKIYCIGGKTSSGFTGVNEVYDPMTNTWETKTPVPTARGWLAAGVVNGKLYLIGGSGDGTINEVYDLDTDLWTIKASVPFAVGRPEVVVVDDEIFVIGSSRLQIYDPETDEWSQGEHPPVGDGYGAGVTSGILAPRRIYVIPNAVYDLETESWMSASGLPSRRYGYGVGIVNDLFYAVGGHTYDSPWSGDFAAINVNEQYTPFGYSSPDLSPPPEPPPTSSPYTPLELTQGAMLGLAITVAVIFAGLGLLVYLIKRK